MPRQRNEQTIAAIHKAARALILTEGYDAASYTALAKATGIARTTIQHYVPYKEEFATRLMQDISDLAYNEAKELLPQNAGPLALSYVAGQVSHGIYYSRAGLRRFLLDISSDRRLQYTIPPKYDSFALDLAGVNAADVSQRHQDLLAQAAGGAFDVHYLCLIEGRFPNSQAVNETIMRLYAEIAHVDSEEVDKIVKRYSFGKDELLQIGKRLAKKL